MGSQWCRWTAETKSGPRRAGKHALRLLKNCRTTGFESSLDQTRLEVKYDARMFMLEGKLARRHQLASVGFLSGHRSVSVLSCRRRFDNKSTTWQSFAARGRVTPGIESPSSVETYLHVYVVGTHV